MKNLTISVIISLVFGYLVSKIIAGDIKSLLVSCVVPSISIFSAIIIGGVGVYLGIIHNMYELLRGKCVIDIEHEIAMLDKIDKITREIRDNIIASFISTAVILFFVLFLYVDVPFVEWPRMCYFNSKLQVSTFVIVACFTFLLFIVYDTIKTMFATHDAYHMLTNLIKRTAGASSGKT